MALRAALGAAGGAEASQGAEPCKVSWCVAKDGGGVLDKSMIGKKSREQELTYHNISIMQG